MDIKPTLKLKTSQRLTLIGRMKMAEWIEMPEKQFAQEVARMEKDALFKKLFLGLPKVAGIIRRQRWPRGSAGKRMYELKEGLVSGGESVPVDKMLEGRAELVELIRKIGQKDFERYFLYAEESLPFEELCRKTGLEAVEVHKVHGFLNDLDIQSEFAGPAQSAPVPGYFCVGKFYLEDGEPYIEFSTSYWARGLYQIRYDQIEMWKKQGWISLEERKKLRPLLKRIETLNLRQNTVYRILESLGKLQSRFFQTQKEIHLRPISLRLLARRLQLAPSTISRVAGGRSIRLPWDKEVPLAVLMPGQRKILRAIIEAWLKENSHPTDGQMMERMRKDCGISVSRRTINAVRNELKKSE